MEESGEELESFRRKWKEEVSARTKGEVKKAPNAEPSSSSRRPQPAPRLGTDRVLKQVAEEDDAFDGVSGLPSDGFGDDIGGSSSSISKEPQSAIEHYEKAVEREVQGSLGDSLNHYRKAFKLDHKVDQKYKQKHFPPSYFASKLTNPNPSNASATVPNTAHHSLQGPPQTVKDLIAGFAGLSIGPAPPLIEGTDASPCPMADLPEEILIGIFKEVAILDVASFVRLAQVCKRMAYLVAREDQVWKRICIGSELGFGAMHYEWQREINGQPLEEEDPQSTDECDDDNTVSESPERLSKEAITDSLLHGVYSSWQQMFRLRPRIRFNGCYISYINYMRPGMASPSQVSWATPVHIITYYRYLRFFRDGTVISLQTTSEPADVVHHLTKELLETHRDGAMSHLPSVVMQQALRGRWRLSTTTDNPSADLKDAEGDVLVDTEAPYPKYIFRMELSLRTAGKGAKNNKLAWKGFWYYNKLTHDLEEFTLRNDRAFIWSRVKSYGNGA
ncbi:F-box pof7 [Hyphodiscus hymeniophilus]|uniref:F-box pof7 n=1 Tax=Hyphodiscus hymeniophilus TaxID=353542 RepID=A0A9P7B049_9HELO|nr:F-box pof7 [Hyphodiscus hymeniophilus]